MPAVADQTDVTTATQANVVQTKATVTLTVGATLPTDGQTIHAGLCVITFATTTAGSPAEQPNCTGNTATILTTTGTASDIARTGPQIAAALRSITNISDTGHGLLDVGGGTNTVSLTTHNTESSATNITFTDGTGGNITASGVTPGVIPKAQINTLSIAGTVETGDIYTATIPTGLAVPYTVLSSDTSTTTIAAALNAAIHASTGYVSQAFTSSASFGNVIFTATAAGTGFTQSSSVTPRTPIAQVVAFNPSGLTNMAYTLNITINDNTYSYVSNGGEIKTDVQALNSLLASDPAVTCTEDNVTITCTSKTAGTAFTYSTSAAAVTTTSSGSHSGGSSGGGGGGGSYRAPITNTSVSSVTSTNNSAPSTVSTSFFSRNLGANAIGSDVQALQVFLNSHGFAIAQIGAGSSGNETTTFGNLTRAALARFQKTYGITPASGYFGPITKNFIQIIQNIQNSQSH